MKISGYGAINSIELTEERMNEFTSYLEDRGNLIKVYEIDEGIGGNIIQSVFGADNLKGRMFEYENYFIAIWSCGEYIDVGVFKK